MEEIDIIIYLKKKEIKAKKIQKKLQCHQKIIRKKLTFFCIV